MFSFLCTVSVVNISLISWTVNKEHLSLQNTYIYIYITPIGIINVN